MSRNRLEEEFQIALVDYLNLVKTANGFMFFSSPNEALGKAKTGAGIGRMVRLKKMGLRHGVSDLIFVKSGRVFFLELKAKKGIQSDYQKEFESDCFKISAPYAIAYSFGDAIKILTDWGILK